MMLLEHEGKAVLASYGVPIPRGVLVHDTSARDLDAALPAVVKAQIPAGKRGKHGGIRGVANERELREAAAALIGSTLRGFRVDSVLVEERLAIARELYLSIAVDRNTSSPVLLASPHGGIDVEASVGTAEGADLLEQPLDLSIGVRGYHVRAAARALHLEADHVPALAVVCDGIWRAFRELEAVLVEVNPLVRTADGRLIAADVKLDLDGRGKGARSRRSAREEGTAFERAAAAFNAVGVEFGGSAGAGAESDGAAAGRIAIVASGAGVLMATADSVAARGGRLAGVLDLGGFPRADETQAAVFRTVGMLAPRVVFFNFFTQVMRCDHYAEAIVAAFGADGAPARAGAPAIVTRMKGFYGDEGRAALARAGLEAVEDYDAACNAAVRAARAS